MPTIVQFSAPYEAELVETPTEELPGGHLRVRTWYSGISAGTELTAYRGTNPYLTKTWEPAHGLFTASTPSSHYPAAGWGYSEVGEVVEVATDDARHDGVAVGDVVAGIWGHRSEGVIAADAATWLPLPDGVEPMHGVFARVGAIALNAVLAADVRLGETAVVFGQGVIGLLATQLALLGGTRVLAVDAMEPRLELARRLGAAHVIAAGVDGGAGAEVRRVTGWQGADSAIELSGSYRALHEAIRSVGKQGTVVAAGFYQGDAQGLRLGEEFHHNQVRIVASQIGATPLALGPRWNERRLLTTFLELLTAGMLDVGTLVTDVVPAEQVAGAFRLLDESVEHTLQVVLRFPGAP
jgi:2-desacetyl-2-hydroxyethyl bacteriochlorophyllide A dehydrogenase